MLKIWGRNNSINVQKVMWCIGELGLAHERVDVGGAFGGLDTPEYGAMNPNRRIPVLQDGDLTLWESQAIVRYLAARHGAGTLWAEDPAVRAAADMWMDWKITTIYADMTKLFWDRVRLPAAERDPVGTAEAVARLGPLWGVLDAHLAQRSYVAGDEMTMGDIPVGVAARRWFYLTEAEERPSHPHLQAWYARLQERAAYRDHVMVPMT